MKSQADCLRIPEQRLILISKRRTKHEEATREKIGHGDGEREGERGDRTLRADEATTAPTKRWNHLGSDPREQAR
jgi:hypothetical protein